MTPATTQQFSSQPRSGRAATAPRDTLAAGWRDIALRVKDALGANNISVVAAGVAFFSYLSVIAALAAAVAIYGLVANPAEVPRHLQPLTDILPQGAREILTQQLSVIVNGAQTALGISLAVGVVLTLWSARSAMRALMAALNIVYGEQEQRGFFKANALALLLTFGAITLIIASIGLVVALPVVFAALGLQDALAGTISLLRWPLLAVVVMLGLAIIYRFGPCRRAPTWRWISVGAVAATVVWIVGSIGFSYYVANFGQYNKIYGSVGAFIILLLWFYLSAFVVLLGATLNAAMEHQTIEDFTIHESRVTNPRGAPVDDTSGERL